MIACCAFVWVTEHSAEYTPLFRSMRYGCSRSLETTKGAHLFFDFDGGQRSFDLALI